MGNVPLYQRRTDDSVEVPNIRVSTGNMQNLDMISRDAGRMAATLQENAEKSYLTQFESDARQQIMEISERNKANPEQMAVEMDAAYKGLAKNASPLIESKLKLNFEMLSRPHVSYAMELKNRIETDKLKETSLTVMNQSMKDLEKNAMMMLSNNSAVAYDASQAAQIQMLTMKQMIEQVDHNGMPLFSAEQRVKFLENANETMITSGIQGWFDSQGNKSAAMKAVLSGQKKFKFYDPEGNVTREIDPYDELDLHTFDKLKSYMEREVKHQQVEVQRAREYEGIQEFLNGDRAIDPKSKKETAIINSLFNESVLPKLEHLPAAEKAQEINRFVDQFGIIPNHVKGMIRTTTRNGTPEQQAFAADLVQRIQETKPQALDDISDKDLSYSIAMANMLRYGLKPEQAVERLKEQFDPLKEDVIKKRRSEIKDVMPILPTLEIQKALGDTSFFGNRFPNIPEDLDISDAMQADYRNIFTQEYIRTGDEQVAKKSANQLFSKTYGVSKISGRPEVMRYPPERYYSIPDAKDDWMREQLLETARSVPKYKDVRDEDIALVADSITARQVQDPDKPSYVIRIRTDDGYEILRDENGEIKRARFNIRAQLDKMNEEIQRQKRERAKFKQEQISKAYKIKESKTYLLEDINIQNNLDSSVGY